MRNERRKRTHRRAVGRPAECLVPHQGGDHRHEPQGRVHHGTGDGVRPGWVVSAPRTTTCFAPDLHQNCRKFGQKSPKSVCPPELRLFPADPSRTHPPSRSIVWVPQCTVTNHSAHTTARKGCREHAHAVARDNGRQGNGKTCHWKHA